MLWGKSIVDLGVPVDQQPNTLVLMLALGVSRRKLNEVDRSLYRLLMIQILKHLFNCFLSRANTLFLFRLTFPHFLLYSSLSITFKLPKQTDSLIALFPSFSFCSFLPQLLLFNTNFKFWEAEGRQWIQVATTPPLKERSNKISLLSKKEVPKPLYHLVFFCFIKLIDHMELCVL